MEEARFCSNCVYPFGYNLVNPYTGRILDFKEVRDRLLCEICAEFLSPGYFPPREYFQGELERYFDTHKRILLAYSGGLDSTVVLSLLSEECKRRRINLEVFTILTGVKGKNTEVNIGNVIKYLGLRGNFFCIDISKVIQCHPLIIAEIGIPMTTVDVYRFCIENNILPCGKICNTMMDQVYRSVMDDKGYDELFTGGDTPKKKKDGTYSIFWNKPSGITIVRGGYAFCLTKENNRKFIEERRFPWSNPQCGGYDTDCLVPGVFLADALRGRSSIPLKGLVEDYPVVLEYLAERVRFGVMDREEVLEHLTQIDVASINCCKELADIIHSDIGG